MTVDIPRLRELVVAHQRYGAPAAAEEAINALPELLDELENLRAVVVEKEDDKDRMRGRIAEQKTELERLLRLEAALLNWKSAGMALPMGYSDNPEPHPFDFVEAEIAKAIAARSHK